MKKSEIAFGILKIIFMYSIIILIIYIISYALYRSVTTPNNRVVVINNHEYIESGYRYTTLIHSESCPNPIHQKKSKK